MSNQVFRVIIKHPDGSRDIAQTRNHDTIEALKMAGSKMGATVIVTTDKPIPTDNDITPGHRHEH